MPATAARIGFVMEPVRRAVSETPATEARHGKLARKDVEPVETFFDDVAHAQIMADQRQAILSPDRRRFGVTVKGLGQAMNLPIAGPALPVSKFGDPSRGIDMTVLIAEVAFDFAGQKAQFVVWG